MILAKHACIERAFLMKLKKGQSCTKQNEHISDTVYGSGHQYLEGLVSVEQV